VPYGGGTGLMGGSLAKKGSIVIDLRKMNRILEISKGDLRVRAEAGIKLSKLNRALSKEGLFLAHDPWSVSFATLGGAIATNALGYLGAKYGSMGDQTLGLKVVLPDGEILETMNYNQASIGFDLKKLFIGTEGVFGIIAEATVQIFPKKKRRILGYTFDEYEKGFELVLELCDSNIDFVSLDFGGEYYEEKRVFLYLVLEGLEERMNFDAKLIDKISEKYGAKKMSGKESWSYWLNRHKIANSRLRMKRKLLNPKKEFELDYIHVNIPRGKVLEYRKECFEIAEEKGVYVVEDGVWHKPELFSMVLYNPMNGNLKEALDEMLILAQKYKGAIEYCHGIGLKLAHLMGNELEIIRRIKKAIDPKYIMNPGKGGL